MKTLILSDAHLDFWAHQGRDPFVIAADLIKDLDAVIFAGDLCNNGYKKWPVLLPVLKKIFGDIAMFILPGNHDFYDFRLLDEQKLGAIAEENGITYAQMTNFTLGKTRVLSATLWTDFAAGKHQQTDMEIAKHRMNDYKSIKLGNGKYHPISPMHTVRVHEKHLNFIKSELELSFQGPHIGPTIVVTHHAPNPDVLGPRSKGVESAYASDLSSLMTGPHAPDAWFFGHAHDSRDMQCGKTKLHCVSLGYADEASDEHVHRVFSKTIFDL